MSDYTTTAQSAEPHSTVPGSGGPSGAPGPAAAGGVGGVGGVGEVIELVGAARRAVDLQFRIWLARIKLAVIRVALRILIVGMLLVAALLLVIIAVPFLYAGVFHVLTDLLRVPTAWALLIFAGAHLLLAGVLGVAAVAVLQRGKRKEKEGAA